MNTAPITLARLLEIENDPALLGYRCERSGLVLWPQVRTVFLRMAMSDMLYGTPLDGSVSKGVPMKRTLATFARSALHNAGHALAGRDRAEVCIFSSAIGHQLVDGRHLNRLSDHFALAQPGATLTVEDHFHWRWYAPRHHERVMFHPPLQARNAVQARLAVRDSHRRQARALVALVAGRGERLLSWRPGPAREQALVDMLARKAAGLPAQLSNYRALLQRVNPKVVLMIGATYGPSAALVQAAHGLGIATAEYQHGTIAPGHDGYNFAPAILDNADYRATLPRHFLSYGPWWHGKVNAPLSMTAVGNPHRAFRVAQAAAPAGGKADLLILADGTEFSIYVELARKLAPQAGRQGLRVVIRPHPLERAEVERRHGACIDGGIFIDQNDDLYTSLAGAHAVVSELSTGMFEAVGLVDKLFMWDTPKARFAFPELPFQGFSSADELAALLGDPASGRLEASQEQGVWLDDWRGRYTAFLASCGVGAARAQAGAGTEALAEAEAGEGRHV